MLSIVFNLAKLSLNEFARFSEESQIVPNRDEGETQKKAKGASKINHQGGDRVDQLLGLDCRLLSAELQNILHLEIYMSKTLSSHCIRHLFCVKKKTLQFVKICLGDI